MFNIKKINLTSYKDETFTYDLSPGINFFKGKNDSGKTEFFHFIDYMFGSSTALFEKKWFKDTLKEAEVEFFFNNSTYFIKRELDPQRNNIRLSDEDYNEPIDLSQYCEKLNTIFSVETTNLIKLRDFIEEDITFRTFTLFNFLGEKSLGRTYDFFEKVKDIKYSIKLPMILNYLFNDNLEEIDELKKEINILERQLAELKSTQNKYQFVTTKVNDLLAKLNIQIIFDGKNKEKIFQELEKIKSFDKKTTKKIDTPISELASVHNDLEEQIKCFENQIHDNKQLAKENKNRKILLNHFTEIVNKNSDFEYLISPINKILNELDKSISFSNYIINDKTIKKLKKERNKIKETITKTENHSKIYKLPEKSRWIAIIEDMLEEAISDNEEKISELQVKLNKLKKELKQLQNTDNNTKINDLSNVITKLYLSSAEQSEIVKRDSNQSGFQIKYYKKGNSLQPMILSDQDEDLVNYSIGSMARFTLIQICGYLGFAKLLNEEKKFPYIPVIVFDHISKPFDQSNRMSIGSVLSAFYNEIDKSEIQIFLFDDENYTDLSIDVDSQDVLIKEGKTGFNPFYMKSSS